jgi:hypothetical protein
VNKKALLFLNTLLYLAALKSQAIKIYWKNQSKPQQPRNVAGKLFRILENCFVWVVAGNKEAIFKECNGFIKPNYYLIVAVLLSLLLMLF